MNTGEGLAPFSPLLALEDPQITTQRAATHQAPPWSRLHTALMQSALVLGQVALAGWDLFRGLHNAKCYADVRDQG